MKYFLIGVLLGILAVALFGCTIHFKGENLEMDVERQRVFHLDGMTLTEFAKTDHKTECEVFAMDNVHIFRSKPQDIPYRKTKFVTAVK